MKIERGQPEDITERYADMPIARLVFGLGWSIRRMRDFEELNAPTVVKDNESSIMERYAHFISLRIEEFRKYVRQIHSGKPLSDGYLNRNVAQICIAIYLERMKSVSPETAAAYENTCSEKALDGHQ